MNLSLSEVVVMNFEPVPLSSSGYRPNNGDRIVHECKNTECKVKRFRGGCTNFKRQEIEYLMLDNYDKFALTWASDAFETCKIILKLSGLPWKPVLTDACSGDGGNVIQFACCQGFSKVNAVELNQVRCKTYLYNNLNIAMHLRPHCKNVEVNIIWGDYLECMKTLQQDVVFLDVPWGGPQYSRLRHCVLHLGNKHIADIIVFLYKNKEHNKTKHVVIMTPFNFDANEMQYRLTSRLELRLLHTFRTFTLHVVSFEKPVQDS
jgi:hypothetical protein